MTQWVDHNKWLDSILTWNNPVLPENLTHGKPIPATDISGAFSPVGTIIDGLIDIKPSDKDWLDEYEYVPPKPEAQWVLPSMGLEPKTGGPNDCPHCLRPRHPGPLTQRVMGMLDSPEFDPEYRPETDDSPVMCVGSDFYGPPRPDGMLRGFSPSAYTMKDIQAMKWAAAPTVPHPKWTINVGSLIIGDGEQK